MRIEAVLHELEYKDSPHYLRRGSREFRCAPDFGHILRHAEGAPCRLQGVYALRSPEPAFKQLVPLVYVCQAETAADAHRLHRLVWNQDIVPFVIVYSVQGVQLFSGFRYNPRGSSDSARGILEPLIAFDAIHDALDSFRASSINNGRLWREWGSSVTPQHRVYWSLLESLKKLDIWLQKTGGLKRETSHALIGKYVYLHYLHGRNILSDRKLDDWRIDKTSVFGRTANRQGLRQVTEKLNRWLNGNVFPIDFDSSDSPDNNHIERVAATFHGDSIELDGTWQLHLDFQTYDFSFIPIETLSMIYERFLHAPNPNAQETEEHEGNADEQSTRGRRVGAYYTPIPVVNLMVAEMEERRPLQRSMRVFDPTCGSGAFLVQCYRRLVEKEFPATRQRPAPSQLKELLQDSIFGADLDPDACSVAEMSLMMTLLDYVDPPDLEEHPEFDLPTLRGHNILCSDFFNVKPALADPMNGKTFDWIIGNPPWKRLDPKRLETDDENGWQWMKAHAKTHPVGGNQLAQAFAWTVPRHLREDGECAMLIPAMALFEEPSERFRAAFFHRNRVHTVVNFANLAEVLFAGRARVPAAAIFYAPRREGEFADAEESTVAFSPFVANQEGTKPLEQGTRNEIWSLVVNSSEVREVSWRDVASGDALPWKLAMWGSRRDAALLRRLSQRFPLLEDLEQDKLHIAEGPQLRPKLVLDGQEATEHIKDLETAKVLDMTTMDSYRRIFAFPTFALKDNKKHFLRVRGGKIGLKVCQPPHIIVSETRYFAIFSERVIVVPPRQIGIASQQGDADLLRALALYISSDFAFYHQFYVSTHFGVKRDVATLKSLRKLPIPFGDRFDRREWNRLHRSLSTTAPRRIGSRHRNQRELFDSTYDGNPDDRQDELLTELNALVSESLGLTDAERTLVRDLVHVRFALNDGKLGEAATGASTRAHMEAYARRLKRELDAFIGDNHPRCHRVSIVHDDVSGMVEVDFTEDCVAARRVSVLRTTREEAAVLEKTRHRLLQPRAQWVYFQRNLRIYEGRRTYIFKPIQRFHWTESQAMMDAGEIIAETIASVSSGD